MKIFIYACEEMYGGLHGIENMRVIETDSFEEANDEGREMSFEVQNDFYSSSDWASVCGVDDENEVEEKLCEEARNEYLCWSLYKIKEDITLSIAELDELCNTLGEEEFRELYCEEEAWEG